MAQILAKRQRKLAAGDLATIGKWFVCSYSTPFTYIDIYCFSLNKISVQNMQFSSLLRRFP